MPNNISNACPACEYERGHAGLPVPVADGMMCRDCGTSWKEVGSSAAHSVKQQPEVSDTPRQGIIDSRIFETSGDDHPPYESEKETVFDGLFAKPVVRQFAPVCAIVLILVASGYFLSELFTKQSIQISEIEMRQQVNSRGGKVVTVQGLIMNDTQAGKRIPKISIVLRQTNGQEITRWYHQSALTRLKPGAAARFSSSIQSDYESAMYAEAVFVD